MRIDESDVSRESVEDAFIYRQLLLRVYALTVARLDLAVPGDRSVLSYER